MSAPVLVPALPVSAAEAHLRLLFERLPVFSWTTDRHLRITSHWGRGLQRRKGPLSSAIGSRVSDYFRCRNSNSAPVKQHHDALLGVSSSFEFSRGGRIFDMTVEPLRGSRNEILGCLGMALDITERKRSDEHMLYQATHDGLTGLFNYRAFFEALEREVLRCERSRRFFSLLLIDLTDLKGINDRFGHLAGNRALKRIARVLKETCRASDLAARFGGDEFAILLIDADDLLASQVAARIDKILSEDIAFPPLSASIGIAVYPRDAVSAQSLFEIADQRLYHNKNAARFQNQADSTAHSTLGRFR